MYGYRPPPSSKPKRDPYPGFEGNEEKLNRARRHFVFNHNAEVAPVTRDQIIGVDYILNDLDPIIDFIKNFSKMTDLKAELDCGVLFIGHPGSGKSFCARYLASASKAKFLEVNDFTRRESRITGDDIRNLFELCREYVKEKNEPIILFWDEFETFASGEGGDRAVAIGQLKQELSGIRGKPHGIFIVAATNNPNGIPGDLLRRGRFTKILFKSLQRKAKKMILQHYIEQYPCEKIDYESISFIISGDQPADIENLVKTVWNRAVLRERENAKLTNDYLATELIRAHRGSPNDIKLSDTEILAIASYEVGRAIVSRTVKEATQLIALTREGYPGAYRIEKYDGASDYVPFDRTYARLSTYFAGAIAQKMFGFADNSMFVEDINDATREAMVLVECFGNPHDNKISLTAFAKTRNNENLPPYGIVENQIYATKKEIEDILDCAYDHASKILKHYGLARINSLRQKLIDKGYLLQMDIDKFLDPEFRCPLIRGADKKRRIGLARTR